MPQGRRDGWMTFGRALVAVLVVLATDAYALGAQGARPARPNILFIMTDDHAAHAIGAYGSRVNKTPNLDRLAREGRAPDERLRHQLDLHAEPRRRSSPASTRTSTA